jgi:hypothetical protein
MSLFVADLPGGYGSDAISSLMGTFFRTLPDIDHVFVLAPESVGMFTPLDSGDAFTTLHVANRGAYAAYWWWLVARVVW